MTPQAAIKAAAPAPCITHKPGQMLITGVAEFDDPAWASAQDALVNDIACLTGNGDCPTGEARDMTLVEVSEADFARAREVLVGTVLSDWAERAGDAWAARWNETDGATVGVSIGN